MKRVDVNELPWAEHAEHAVLGALMLDPMAWDRCGDLLTSTSFFDARNGHVFGAIGKLVNSGKPADVVSVYEELTKTGMAEDCGGLGHLNALQASVPSANAIRRHAEIVAEKAGQRALMQTADEALEIAVGAGEFTPKLDTISGMFAQLQQTGQRSRPMHTSDLVCMAIDRINALAEGNVHPGMPTHIAGLNRILGGGLDEGMLLVLAARPGVGKSSLALDLLIELARLGYPGLFLSLEMPKLQVVNRALAKIAGISLARIKAAKLSEAEWGRLSTAVDELGRLPIFIDDQAGLTLRDIRAKAMLLRREGIKVMVLDYIQLCRGPRGQRSESRAAEIAEISRGLKELAKELGMAIIVLSQLNREVEKRGTQEPNMSDLRESGAIEQDADVILLLWLAQKFAGHKLINALLAKVRDGEAGVRLQLRFEGHYQRWQESLAQPQQQAAQREMASDFDEPEF